MDTEWPLQGRGRELRILSEVLTRQPTSAIVLAGAPGVGKTRLAREFQRLAEQAGHWTLWISATRSAAGIPFGALSSALPSLPSDARRTSTDRSEFLRRSIAVLLERAESRPLAIVVDDAHLLDESSAMLIHQLVVARSAAALVTVRAGEPAPELMTALWKEEFALRLDVQGLGSAALEELLTAVLGGQLDPGVLAHLTVRCQGNVLLLRELVLSALSTGALAESDGVWALVKPLAPSDRLLELVEIRLNTLSPAQRRLLEVVSYGEPLGSAELAAFDATDLAQELERKDWVSSTFNDRRLEIRLRHPLYGDVLRATMPRLRVREIALRLAEAVESTGARRREDVLRTMVWRLDAGGGPPDSMLEAALIARWRYDFELADRLVRAALSSGAGFEATLLLGQLMSLRGEAAAAERHLAEVNAPDDSARARVAIARLDNMVFSLGQPQRGLRIAKQAELTVTDPRRRDEIAAHRTGVVISTQGPAAGAAAAAPIVARSTGRALVWSSMPAVVGLSRLGRIDEALAAVEKGSAAHQRLLEPIDWYPWFHHFLRCVALDAAGRFTEATTIASELYTEGVDEHSLEKRAVFAWQLTTSAEARGHPAAAVRYGREAVTLFRELGRESFVQSVLPSLATATALSGSPDAAAKVLASAELQTADQPLWTPAYLPIAHAWTAIAAGDHRAGAAAFRRAADQGEDIGDLVGATAALHGLARIGNPRAAVDRLDTHTRAVEGPLIRIRLAHCRAQLAKDATALQTIAQEFSTCGADLLAAEAAADAAVALRRTGRPKAATAAARVAASLAEACGRPRTPALMPAESRATLTPAEQETALLAAAGYSSKEIAEQLTLSARTIDNRLRRIYEKLGISSRSAISDALG